MNKNEYKNENEWKLKKKQWKWQPKNNEKQWKWQKVKQSDKKL